MKNLKSLFIAIMVLTLISASCKKAKVDAHIPPDVIFKTDAGYTSADKTLHKQDTILVGITATKTEDDLKSYNVSFSYDGNTTSTTFFDYKMADNEKTGYSKDIKIIARNVIGSEKWFFSIVDRDGNITQKTIVLTVN